MKKFFFRSILALSFISAVSLVTACGGKDEPDQPEIPDEPQINLSVNPSTLSLTSDASQSASFMIESNSNWAITNNSDWLNLSTTSGKGNTSVVVTTLNQNQSSESRTATLNVISGDQQASIVVSQLPAYQSGCDVNIKKSVVLANSMVFELEFGPNVDYYYYGYLSREAAGYTDERIINIISEFDAHSSDEDLIDGSNNDLDPNTSYYACLIGYDSKGRHGNLVKKQLKTPAVSNNIPYASVEDVKVSDTKFFWSTVINAYTEKYYMVSYTDPTVYAFLLTTSDAMTAYFIQDAIERGANPIAREGDWEQTHGGQKQIYIATWACGPNNTYSPMIFSGGWHVKSNAPIKKAVKDLHGFKSARSADLRGKATILHQ